MSEASVLIALTTGGKEWRSAWKQLSFSDKRNVRRYILEGQALPNPLFAAIAAGLIQAKTWHRILSWSVWVVDLLYVWGSHRRKALVKNMAVVEEATSPRRPRDDR